jgi:hypothetical protein
MNNLKVFKEKEICKILGICKKTAYNYRVQNMIKYGKINGRIFYNEKDVNDFINNHLI